MVLSWPRAIEAQSGGTSWTEIANQIVNVETEGRYRGECSDFTFKAVVPVTNVIPAKNIARLTMSISEVPRREKRDYLSGPFGLRLNLPSPLPSSIMEWSELSVIVEPQNDVFPNELSVSRQQN